MTARGLRSLAQVLNDSGLKDLATEAERRRGVTERVRALLPSEEAAHLVSATTGAGGELVVVMDASVWAARVRYLAGHLGAERLRVKVLPRPGQSDKPGTS